MFFKLLIYSFLISMTLADDKYLSKNYLPPTSQEAVIAKISKDDLDVPKNEIVENDLKLEGSALTKEADKDSAYDNIPFGYNGFPGGFPVGFSNQGFPDQGFTRPSFLRPVFYPQQGIPPQYGFPPQYGIPGQGFAGPGIPTPHGFAYPGFPQQGFPVQGFPAQGSNYPVPPGQVYPIPPIYFSNSERLKAGEKEDKLRLRMINSDSKYGATNGGYLYNKPNIKF